MSSFLRKIKRKMCRYREHLREENYKRKLDWMKYKRHIKRDIFKFFGSFFERPITARFYSGIRAFWGKLKREDFSRLAEEVIRELKEGVKRTLAKQSLVESFRSFTERFHFLIWASILAAVLIFVYLIIGNQGFRLDMTKGKSFSLSQPSLNTLDRLEDMKVKASVFMKADDSARGEITPLLEAYAREHGNFKYYFVDPDRFPLKAKEFGVEKYGVIVFETSGRKQKARALNEDAINYALNEIAGGEKKKILFVKGHGEISFDDTGRLGLELFARRLLKNNYQLEQVSIYEDTIPEECDLIIVASPKADLNRDELVVLEKYLQSGGSILFLIDPSDESVLRNTSRFLRNYGVILGADVIVDKENKLYGSDLVVPMVNVYQKHAVTKGITKSSFFPLSRSVNIHEDYVPNDVKVLPIAFTSEKSWVETDIAGLQSGESEYDSGYDRKGPIPIAVSVVGEPADERPEFRMVVFGDSDFVNNTNFGLAGNRDLIMNAVNWLSRDAALSTARSSAQTESTPLVLTEKQARFIFGLTVVFLPSAFVILGGGVLFWRRRFS